jgi:nucleotide-binding universal stress UspA family protein
MVQRVMVPVDGSPESWRAIGVGVALGRRCAAPVDVVEVVLTDRDRDDAERRVVDGVRELDVDDVEIIPHVELANETVAASLADLLERRPEATIVMSSHGRGRSAALLGSVTEDLLHREFGPIVVVGPNVRNPGFGGPLVVTVDGSDLSEQALPLGAAWAIELGVQPWIVEVYEPGPVTTEHLLESSYLARLARHISEASKHPTEFEVLHGSHPEDAVADFAKRLDASLVVSATHGRTGLSRLCIGSTAAAFVRSAPCPVLLIRPPFIELADGHGSARSSSA